MSCSVCPISASDPNDQRLPSLPDEVVAQLADGTVAPLQSVPEIVRPDVAGVRSKVHNAARILAIVAD